MINELQFSQTGKCLGIEDNLKVAISEDGKIRVDKYVFSIPTVSGRTNIVEKFSDEYLKQFGLQKKGNTFTNYEYKSSQEKLKYKLMNQGQKIYENYLKILNDERSKNPNTRFEDRTQFYQNTVEYMSKEGFNMRKYR